MGRHAYAPIFAPTPSATHIYLPFPYFPMSFLDLFRQLRPLRHDDQTKLESIGKHLSSEEQDIIYAAYRQRKLAIHFPTFGTGVVTDEAFPQLHLLAAGSHLEELAASINAKVRSKVEHKLFHRIADHPLHLSALLAPHLRIPAAKEAILLQIFSRERFHILLAGDTGAEQQLLHDAAALAPRASAAAFSRKKAAGAVFSALQQADQGLCCLSGLQHLNNSEQAALASAMEKGEAHPRGKPTLDARIKVLAAVSPRKSLAAEALPISAPLLRAFSLIFFLKKGKEDIPDAGQLPAADLALFQDFARFASSVSVQFPSALEHEVLAFVERLQKKSRLSHPHLISAVISMAQALSRMHLADKVGKSELRQAMDIMEQSLAVQNVSAASRSR